MTLKNLVPGQYQIGDLIMGRGTTVRVETFDIKPYDVNVQDFQQSRTDEIGFGWDQLKPTTIEITFHVLNNQLLPGFEDLIPNFWSEMPTVDDFQLEWRSDDIRYTWGAMKPLYVCDRNGLTKMIFGRPGQFTYGQNTPYTESVQCLGEFRRADTLAYTAKESVAPMAEGDAPIFIGCEGDSPSWFRILGIGPMTNPVFTVGNIQIRMDIELEADEFLEISGYPWARRVVDSNRVNHANDMIAPSPYLDKLLLPPIAPVPVRWTSDDFNTWVPALGNQSWQEDIADHFKLPGTFTTIAGNVVVRFNPRTFVKDVLGALRRIKFKDLLYTVSDVGKYLAAGRFADTSAIIYNDKKFATANQRVQARPVGPMLGRSAMTLMSNEAMTNFAMLELSSELTHSYMRIRTGSAFNTYSAVRDEWENDIDIIGWDDDAVIAFESEFDEVSGDTTYYGLYNGEIKVSWTDTANVVSSAATNRSNGFIFDLDGDLLSPGTGFTDILCFDTAVVAVPTGKAFILWHDAWSTI